MPTLHLGVVEQPYRSNKGKELGITTFEVAKHLEKKYGIMLKFYDVRQKEVIGSLEQSVARAVAYLIQGQRIDPFGGATQKIQSAFRDFIVTKQAEGVGIPGTPTGAALAGVNHRLAHPYAAGNPRRPSFLDTGLYLSSFRAWIS
jgi:hypothetical protein